jgi:hypothetical protein
VIAAFSTALSLATKNTANEGFCVTASTTILFGVVFIETWLQNLMWSVICYSSNLPPSDGKSPFSISSAASIRRSDKTIKWLDVRHDQNVAVAVTASCWAAQGRRSMTKVYLLAATTTKTTISQGVML